MEAVKNPPPMIGAGVLGRQWERYGDIVSRTLRLDRDYSEAQCAECPHEHACCNLMVMVTPYEALGIMAWLKSNLADWRDVLARVKMRAAVLHDFYKRGQFKNVRAACDAWWARSLKCVFYDHAAKRCMIYPVRPVNCRTAYGQGECADEQASGVRSIVENPEMMALRLRRARLPQLEAFGQSSTELCSMITLLREPTVQITAEPADQKLLQTDPELLSDDQVLWGLGARPMDNPWTEESPDGNS